MYLHHEARLAYLANPRVASKSTAEALLSVGFAQVDNVCASPSGLHHLTVAESKRDFAGWTVFTTVRNHWDTVASWLLHWSDVADVPAGGRLWTVDEVRGALDVNPWVGEHTLWHRHRGDTNALLRFENLDDDLRLVLWYHGGINMPSLSRVGAGEVRGGRPYQEFFDDETRDYVGQRFGDEISTLGYGYE